MIYCFEVQSKSMLEVHCVLLRSGGISFKKFGTNPLVLMNQSPWKIYQQVFSLVMLIDFLLWFLVFRTALDGTVQLSSFVDDQSRIRQRSAKTSNSFRFDMWLASGVPPFPVRTAVIALILGENSKANIQYGVRLSWLTKQEYIPEKQNLFSDLVC